MPAIPPRYKLAKAQRSAAVSGLRERLEQLRAERDILRKKKRKVTPTLLAIQELEEELERYDKMDVDGPEEEQPEGSTDTNQNAEDLETLRKQWRQLPKHEAKPRGKKGSEPRQPREKGEPGLFVSESDGSGYESEVIEPVEASLNPLSTTPSDGKDLCYTKRGRAYYVISQHGPDKGYKKYFARKASLHAIQALKLQKLTKQRPDPGTFRVTGIQGVVVAPGHDFRALLRKYWKTDTKKYMKKNAEKDETTKQKCPWIQIKVQYVDTADGEEDENKKKCTAFFSRSMLAQKYPDGDGIVILNEKLCLFGNVVLREGTSIEKLDLAILRAYIHNQEHFDDSPSKGRQSRSPTVQRYSTPALNATRDAKSSSTSTRKSITFAKPAARFASFSGADTSSDEADAEEAQEYAEFQAWRRSSLRPDVVASTAAGSRKAPRVKVEDEDSEEL